MAFRAIFDNLVAKADHPTGLQSVRLSGAFRVT